jgi:hypothetical protein
MAQDYDEETQSKGEEILKGMRDEAASKTPSFKEAFASARSGGGKDFEWNGKKYSTELASDKKATPTSKAASETSKATPETSKTASKPASETSARVGRAGQASVDTKEKNPVTNESLAAAREKWSNDKDRNPPSAMSRMFSSIRDRGQKSNPDAYAKGGSVSSASRRADGIASKGKTKGTLVMCGGGMARK